MGVAVSVSHIGEPIFKDRDPAYDDDAAASYQADEEHHFYNVYREEHDSTSHIEAHWKAIGIRTI